MIRYRAATPDANESVRDDSVTAEDSMNQQRSQTPILPVERGSAAQILLFMMLALAGSAIDGAGAGRFITWRGDRRDPCWSRPSSWQGGVVPGPGDVARFDRASGDATSDAAFAGMLAGIVLERDYAGTVTLARTLDVTGSAVIGGGTIEQGRHRLTCASWVQTGGAFSGGSAPLTITGHVQVVDGVLTTPHALMRVETMEIRAPGVVRIGADGKLELSGDGEPLVGDGVLDTMTNRPTSLELTGKTSSDVTLVAPTAGSLGRVLGNQGEGTPQQRASLGASTGPMVSAPQRAFGATSTLLLQRGDCQLTAAAIDSAAGFAYFGTHTAPGAILKVRLADFTVAGTLTLQPGEDYIATADIDPAAGFGYFGTSQTPSKVVKVRLADLTRVATLKLNTFENWIMSSAIDTAGGFVYYGTSTSPGIVIKVRLSDLSRVAAVTLAAGSSYASAAVIDPAAGFVYFSQWSTYYTSTVKLRLADLGTEATLTLPSGAFPMCGVIDTIAGYAYFCVTQSTVYRVRLADFSVQGGVALPGEAYAAATAVIDPVAGNMYVGSRYSPAKVFQVRLSDLTHTGTLTLETDETELGSGVIDPSAGFAYFGTLRNPGRILKVRLTDLTRADALVLDTAESQLYCAAADEAAGFAYFGTYTLPGVVIKVRLSDFSRVGALALPEGESLLSSSVIDVASGFLYVGTWTAPGRVVKIRLSDFTRDSSVLLGTGENYLASGVVDTVSGFAYFGTDTTPGRVVKVGLSDFKRVGALSFGGWANQFRSAVIDTAVGTAYFASYWQGGTVVKVRLADFTSLGYLQLSQGGYYALSAAYDPAGFAFFGGYNAGASIYKTRLSDFTVVGELPLSESKGRVGAIAIDSERGLGFFAVYNYPGWTLLKVRLENMQLLGETPLGAGDGEPSCALPRVVGGYAYFGTNTNPGRVIRVDTGATSLAVGSSANPSTVGEAVTFTATVRSVAGGGGTPVGSVGFKADGAVIGGCESIILDGGGAAPCTTSALPGGVHTIVAEYSGSGADFDSSTGSLAGGQVVNPIPLTVIKAGSGAVLGSVSSVPPGIDCGATCVAGFDHNTVVTLFASGGASTSFAGWSGEGCSGIGNCVVTVSQARHVTATFVVSTVRRRLATIEPCRAFDTRSESGGDTAAPALGAHERRVLHLAGRCGVPAEAAAISANITVVGATAQGDLRIVGGHLPDTVTSALAIPVARARANNAIIQLSADGDSTIAVTNDSSGTVHVIVDINGYFV
jgi:hypothetical protein